VATGSLTFFQQIGGTIGLTLAGTVLANRLVTEIPTQWSRRGAQADRRQIRRRRGAWTSPGPATWVNGILASVPPEAKAVIEPLIPNIVQGIHEAFSIRQSPQRSGSGIAGALLAFVFRPLPAESNRCGRLSRSRSGRRARRRRRVVRGAAGERWRPTRFGVGLE
jgi:hypothetical protein